MFRFAIPDSEDDGPVILKRRSRASALPSFPHGIPPRYLILLALYGLFVAWMCIAAVIHFGEVVDAPARYPYGDKVFLLCVDTWAIAASLGVGFIVWNPPGWLDGKRLIIGCLMLGAMLGRIACRQFGLSADLHPDPKAGCYSWRRPLHC